MAYRYKKNDKGIYLLFGILSLVFFLVSSSVLPFLLEMKNFPVPELMLCFVCILPCFLPVKAASIYALALGFLGDLFINSPVCFSPVIYLAAVCMVPYFHGYFARVGVVTAAVCALPALILKGIAGTAVLVYTYGASNFWDIASDVMLPELGVNLASCIVVSALMFLIVGKSRFKSVK